MLDVRRRLLNPPTTLFQLENVHQLSDKASPYLAEEEKLS